MEYRTRMEALPLLVMAGVLAAVVWRVLDLVNRLVEKIGILEEELDEVDEDGDEEEDEDAQGLGGPGPPYAF